MSIPIVRSIIKNAKPSVCGIPVGTRYWYEGFNVVEEVITWEEVSFLEGHQIEHNGVPFKSVDGCPKYKNAIYLGFATREDLDKEVYRLVDRDTVTYSRDEE